MKRVFPPFLLALALAAAVAPAQGRSRQRTVVPGSSPAVPDAVTSPAATDPHHGGSASQLRLVELSWGRLVDIHRLRADGSTDPRPVRTDYVIHAGVRTDEVRWRLETDRLAGRDRLVVLASDPREVAALVQRAGTDLPTLSADAFAVAQGPTVPRNAALVLRFDDLLDDGPAAGLALAEMVQLTAAEGSSTALPVRVLFDRHHGGVHEGKFHSTRVILDPTVSTLEALEAASPVSENPLGFPGDVTIHLAARASSGAGRPHALRNLAGARLRNEGGGEFGVRRQVRVAEASEAYGGFLADDTEPHVTARWPSAIDAAADDPTGVAGRDFVIDLSFRSACAKAPVVGDVLFTDSSRFLEVTAPGTYDSLTREVTDLPVHLVNRRPVSAALLLGFTRYLTNYDPASTVDPSCWLDFTPHPRVIPVTDVAPDAVVKVRFSEPMATATVRPHDSFLVVRGDSSTATTATNIVAAAMEWRWHQREFSLTPLLPFAHTGSSDPYHVEVAAGSGGVTDLAGNSLADALPEVDFTIDPAARVETNGGIVLRFNEVDEYQRGAAAGAMDVRGQFLYDLDRGVVKARPVTRFAAAADRSHLVPRAMIPFPSGVQVPLTPLGAKLHSAWRYADFGWHVLDETRVNIDVEGLSWSPVGGAVVTDYYEEFEMRLAHAYPLPDEDLGPYLLPEYPSSGLIGAPHLFDDNVLDDPEGGQTIVHHRALGYLVSPADLYTNGNGTPLLPYPMNQGDWPPTTYTWRDTAVLGHGGPHGAGIPTGIEESLGLVDQSGAYAGPGEVPSIGLPLLMEYRCFPSDTGIGLNALDVSLATNSSSRPNFRSFSAGGVNQSGAVVLKNPDLELVPSGGFNPGSTPPGAPTPEADNVWYVGQADFVVRVSRVHTVWFDTELVSPSFLPVLSEANLPDGTEVRIHVRSAHGFDPAGSTAPFDASRLDAYGDAAGVWPLFASGDETWSDDLTATTPGRYVQVRVSLIGNTATTDTPEISTLGLVYEVL